MSIENWALFQNQYRQAPLPLFAAILLGRTAKMVHYVVRHPGDDPQDPRDPVKRKADWLVMEGLTEDQARSAAEKDKQSRAALELERAIAFDRHMVARNLILQELTTPPPGASEDE